MSDDIVEAVYSTVKKKLGLTPFSKENFIAEMNSGSSQYAYEKLLINHLIYAQTVYCGKKGLKVIWSTHEQLREDLVALS